MHANQVIAGRFDVERLAGKGGMGAVYRARDRHTGEPVAIKVLHAAGPRETERFVREGNVLATLEHPGIVRYVAHGFTDEQEAYLAMEWLDGEDLSARLANSPLSPREGITVVRGAAAALASAHARGIVHRDIKPSNLFLVGGDVARVRVLDFGIARRGAASVNMTRTGAVVGTPGYMAPEQARGDRTLDARTDVFALGCVLFECLAGRPLFAADNMMALLARILLEEPPRLREVRPDLPDAVDALVTRMLSKAPEQRPADARDVVAALDALGELPDVHAPGKPTPPVAITRVERRSLSVVLLRGMAHAERGSDESPAWSVTPGRTGASAVEPVAATVDASSLVTSGSFDPLERVRAVALAWGGRTEALADGSVVVTIATRDPAADQAIRAARCALALQEVVPDALVAAATGRGEMSERLPVGEVIDDAAKLIAGLETIDGAPATDRATPPPVRINEVIAGLLDARFEVKRESGEVLVLRGERAGPDAVRTLLGRSTTCVGRDRELASLEATFAECADESLARVAVVTAPAGVGKSRLRYEFVRRLTSRPDPPAVWLARGDPMRAGSPFGMLAQALRAAFELLDNEPVEARRAKLLERLGERLAPPRARHVADFLGEVVGVPAAEPSPALKAARQDASAMNDQLQRAWLEYLGAECAARPVVIVFEDLQWADRTSCAFVDVALRDLSQAPLLVLGLARPEVDEVHPRLWAERGLVAMRLPELPKKASERLARQVLGAGVAQETVDRIVARSAGNAFFLEELIRAVAEGKGDSLPGSVLAMAEARLESLDVDERRLLRAASVFGQVFQEGGVRSLLGATAQTGPVREWLGSLVQREFVTRRGPGKFAGESDYAFRQGIVREAAYSMLTPADRALGHRLAGTWLESMGETESATLAEHFERGGDTRRAVKYYVAAAEHALKGGDLDAVRARVEHGVACGAAGEDLSALYVVGTEALMWQGAYAESQKRALAALELLPRGEPLWFKALGLAMWLSRNVNDRANMVRLAETMRAQGPSPEAGGAPAMAWALGLWSLLLLRKYDLAAEVTTWLERLERDPSSPHDTRTLAWIHFGLHFGRLHIGRPESAYRDAQRAAQYFLEYGDRLNGGAAYSCLSRAALAVGQDDEAERSALECMALDSDRKLGAIYAASQRFLAYVLVRRGDVATAVARMDEALEFLATEKNAALLGHWRTDFAIHAAIARAWDVAEGYVTASLEVLRAAPPLRALALVVLARVRTAQGRVDEAVAMLREADAVFDAVGAIGDGETFVRLVRAETLRAAGRAADARVEIAEAAGRVRDVAAQITDPELRAGFLERVPENTQVLALAAELAAG